MRFTGILFPKRGYFLYIAQAGKNEPDAAVEMSGHHSGKVFLSPGRILSDIRAYVMPANIRECESNSLPWNPKAAPAELEAAKAHRE